MINCKLSASTTLEFSVNTNLEILEAEVLQLAPVERSHLLERLIASLDADPEVEVAWELEADRRESELASGLVATISGTDAIARLRAKLQPYPSSFTSS
jgi:Putative addiction module component